MTINGTITAALPETNGTSNKTGNKWRRREYVITYDNSKPEFPKSVLFSVLNDNIDRFNLQVGKDYQLDVDFTTREYEGRFYMEGTCWRTKERIVDATTGEIKYA